MLVNLVKDFGVVLDTCNYLLGLGFVKIYYLTYKSDQYVTTHCKINILSSRNVMRIKKIIGYQNSISPEQAFKEMYGVIEEKQHSDPGTKWANVC